MSVITRSFTCEKKQVSDNCTVASVLGRVVVGDVPLDVPPVVGDVPPVAGDVRSSCC